MSEATCDDLEEEIDVLMEEAKLDESIPTIKSRSVFFSNSMQEGSALKSESEKEFSKQKFRSTSPQESDFISESRDFPPRPSTQNIVVEAAEEIDVSGNTFSPSERLQSITKSGSIGCPKVQSNQLNSSLNFEGCEEIGFADDDKEPIDDCVTNLSPEFRKIFLELDRMLAKRMNEISLLSDLPAVSEESRSKYEDLAKEIHKSLHSESNESREYRGYKYE